MLDYSETIRNYALDDRFTGELPAADGIGEVGLNAEEAGRKLAVRFALQVTGGTIVTARYQVFGCGYTMAACAAAAELAEGMPLASARKIDAMTIDQGLGGLPAERGYCAALAAEALQAALRSIDREQTVSADLNTDSEEHGPRITAAHPVYRALIDGPATEGIPAEDRHLFACLLAIASSEETTTHRALNLSPELLQALLLRAFPHVVDRHPFLTRERTSAPPDINPEIEALLDGYRPAAGHGWPGFAALLLARIIAGRAAHPGHLWVAMGLTERPQLSAAIGRHLPALKAANHRNMRWKRFLFKQVCDLNGGTMCKTPNCGDCSDYVLCFAPDD